MSEDTTKQTVVDEPKTPAQPGAEVDGARNDGTDLETLLAQFETETKKSDPPPSPPPAAQQQPPTSQPDPNFVRLVNRIERQDLDKLVKDVKGDLDVDDDLVEALIDAQARKDTRLQRAWAERDSNPRVFAQITKELGRTIAKKFAKRPDPNLTEDREVVAAAVRGASTNKAPPSPPPNYGNMSHNEYRNKVREQYGFDPG